MQDKFDISVFDGLHATDNPPWNFDILIYNRFSQPLDFLREAKKRGVKLIADIDDSIILPKGHPNYNYYHSNEQVEHLKESIRIADHQIIQEQNLSSLLRDIKKLKPHYQEVINLRYFHELSYADIADQLNEPINNVKVKLLRAKKLLAEIIKNK
jgi:RNA polymerase sigma factor (sigma-70 family)